MGVWKSASPQEENLEGAISLAKKKKRAEALDLIGRIIAQNQDAKALETAMDWLRDDRFVDAAGELAVCTLAARIQFAIDGTDEPARNAYRELCLQAVRRFDRKDCPLRQDTTDRSVTECIVLRHMEQTEEAKALILEAAEEQNTGYRSIFCGLCLMDLEEGEAAEQWIRRGLELDPENASGCNDMADYFFNRRKFEKAEEFYGLVLGINDSYSHDWARPSWYFCRFMLESSKEALEQLLTYSAMNLDSNRAAWLCGYARRELLTPYVDYLPESSEAVINGLRSMREQNVTGVRTALSCEEAASSINAVRLHFSQYGKRESSFEIIVSTLSDPPLDTRLIPDGVALWRYLENHDTEPAVERPTEKVTKIVRKLASGKFDLKAWYENAKASVQALGPEAADSLYGCMVYPPEPGNPEIPTEEWLMLVQFAAVCLLAAMGKEAVKAESEEMKDYVRRLPSPELVRICLGQLDWPVVPALSLLAWQAEQGIADRETVLSLLSDKLMKRVSRNGYCFFEHALYCALERFPELDDAYRRELHRRRIS